MKKYHETCRYPSTSKKRKFIQESSGADAKFSSPMPYRSESSSPPPAPKRRSHFRFEEETESLTMFLPDINEIDPFHNLASPTKGISLKPRLIFSNATKTSVNSNCVPSSDGQTLNLEHHKHSTKIKSPSKVQNFWVE
jgi:hypothetical protein